MDSFIFPGVQGQGHVTLGHVNMTKGNRTLKLDSRKNQWIHFAFPLEKSAFLIHLTTSLIELLWNSMHKFMYDRLLNVFALQPFNITLKQEEF